MLKQTNLQRLTKGNNQSTSQQMLKLMTFRLHAEHKAMRKSTIDSSAPILKN
jgi:hypothetical protein